MIKNIFIILSVLYLFATISSVLSRQILTYDILVLAQIWKRSSCCFVNNLESPSPNYGQCQFTNSAIGWTIHGLWPTDSTRINKVEFCPNSIRGINFKKYPPNLLANMKRFWRNNKPGVSNERFWWYQWRKHGTCAIEIPETKNHTSYFSKTVDLYGKNRVGNMLDKEKIVPNHGYDVDDIYMALQKNLQNHKPVVRCINRRGISYLSEVYLCFTKEFNLKPCSSKTNCNKNVYYP